ncbi:MAG: SpoIIE family protein phosphatase [Candidatus Omnitrophica bacterium]|nr:SpoIIE family protein phosphatase [Candidatus Omnitrophota bacterium]
MATSRGITFKLSLFILVSCTVIFTAIFGYNYLFSRRIIAKNIAESAKNLTSATVNKIDSVLQSVEKSPQNIAAFLEQSSCTKEEIMGLLRSAVESNPEIYGATIAFEPYGFDKGSLYFAPYFYKSEGETKFSYLGGDSYQYFYWDWYQIPKELDRPVWSEPYFDEGGGGVIMSTYSVPFYETVDGKRQFMGIVTADVSLAWLQEIVSSIKIAKTGYGFLISRNGTVLTHPSAKFIMNDTIFGLAEVLNDKNMRRLGRDMINGKSGFAPSAKNWICYAPLASSGWSLGVVFPKSELMADITNLNRIMWALALIGIAILFVVIILISRSITKPLRVLARATGDIAKGNLDFEMPAIKSKDEVGGLADSFIYMRTALKKYIKDLTETTAAKERMESELHIARDIQMSILPKIFPPFPHRSEFDIYAMLEPAKEVGGDLYDFFFIDNDNFCFVVGDVSGKGVPASLFMAIIKTLIKATAKDTKDPAEILNKVNKDIATDNTSRMFITIFCGVLNLKSGEVFYVNCGHNPPLVLRSGGESELIKGPGGPAVGIFAGLNYEKGRFLLGVSDTVCLYTDGVTEAFNERREQFSLERLKKELAANKNDSVRRIIERSVEGIKSFVRGAPQSDDITLLALRYFGKA